MECFPIAKVPKGSQWAYEIKLDGYRAVAVKSDGKVMLYSRRKKSFNSQYPYLVDALKNLPDGTVVDGEIVSLDDSGRPNFHLLQKLRSEASRIHYFVFDLLVSEGRDLTGLPLSQRRQLLAQVAKLNARVRVSDQFDVPADQMLFAVQQQGLEGVVAKRKASLYEAGKRTGAWAKCRVNRGQEFVVGGYIPGPHGFDSLIVGYYRGNDLVYVARVRNGFVPATRRQVFEKISGLVSPEMPFVNLPDEKESRWGESLTPEKMKRCAGYVRKSLLKSNFLNGQQVTDCGMQSLSASVKTRTHGWSSRDLHASSSHRRSQRLLLSRSGTLRRTIIARQDGTNPNRPRLKQPSKSTRTESSGFATDSA